MPCFLSLYIQKSFLRADYLFMPTRPSNSQAIFPQKEFRDCITAMHAIYYIKKIDPHNEHHKILNPQKVFRHLKLIKMNLTVHNHFAVHKVTKAIPTFITARIIRKSNNSTEQALSFFMRIALMTMLFVFQGITFPLAQKITPTSATGGCAATVIFSAYSPSVNATTDTWTAPSTGGPFLV
jgi:hypothetical protein